MRYPIINGWTAAAMKQAILDGNNGRKAQDGYICRHRDATGNRCYVGCFIPDWHRAMQSENVLDMLLWIHPDLASMMPLAETGMAEFQRHHDLYFGDEDMAARACRWIDQHCYDVFD